jgi:hypothetical protein
LADQHSLAELNYVYSILNTVHLSRSAFKEEHAAVEAGGLVRAG